MFEASLGYTPCLNKYLNSLSKKVKGWVHWLCPGAKCINSHILFSHYQCFCVQMNKTNYVNCWKSKRKTYYRP